METISAGAVAATLRRIAAFLPGLRDELNALDAALGDGDTGITVSKGGAGLQTYLDGNAPGDDIGGFLMAAGMAFNRAAPSTLGALIATALMRAGKEAKGVSELDGPLLARMLAAADTGVQERGKSKPGDKTIVDALHPAAEAFAGAVAAGQGIAEAGDAALAAARAGCDAVTPLASRVGRAGWVGSERTEGKPDPGATLFVAILAEVRKQHA